MSAERAVEDERTLVAELWYADAPDLFDPRLLDAVRAVSENAEVQAGSISVPHRVASGNGQEAPPLVTVVMAGTPLGEGGKAGPDPSQTWDWAEAESAVERCRSSLIVTELFAEPYSAQTRLSALTRVVAALAERTRPIVLSWPHSQRLADPEDFEPDAIDDVVNVRFFSVGDSETEMVMDTRGLAVFGLPDVQCHYRDANPAEIAAVLSSTARYLFDHGDVIGDGDTISGLHGDEHYVCRHETALVGPPRRVIDVDLGPPYAAGRRDQR